MDPLAVLLHPRVRGIPIGDTASGANIAGLPPNYHLADGGRLMGGWYRMGLALSGHFLLPYPCGTSL